MFKTIQIIFSLIFVVLWIGGILSYTILEMKTDVQPITAPLFLWCAAFTSFLGFVSSKKNFLLLGASIFAFVVEIIGVHTGIIFGSYLYSGEFGMVLFGVPVVIVAAWFILLAYVWNLTSRFKYNRIIKSLISSLWMVAIDLIIDPISAGPIGFWQWKTDGMFYGVPVSNFLGWFGVSVLIFLFLHRDTFYQSSSHLIGFSIILFFSILALQFSYFALVIVGILLIVIDIMFLRHSWRMYIESIRTILSSSGRRIRNILHGKI